MAPRNLWLTRPRLSTLCLLTVGSFDLVTTLIWLRIGGKEGNPLFAWIAHASPLALIAAKLLFLFGPILILEHARKTRPLLAELATWLAFLAYVYLYGRHLLALV